MNLNYLFWVDYYKDLGNEDSGQKHKRTENEKSENEMSYNEKLTGMRWKPGEPIPKQEQFFCSFCMKVMYPGLLTGLGYAHDSGMMEDDCKEIGLGMTLDYVTGLPVVPGSAVKGILRGAFRENEEYVAEVFKECGGPSLEAEQIMELENRIFGGQHPSDRRRFERKTEMGEDKFLDAFPVQADKNDCLLDLENITPHRSNDEYNGLTSPTILNLLKVRPGVVFLFRFAFRDTDLESGVKVTKEQKLELFKKLLQDLGVGAKTNVGFGGMTPVENTKDYSYSYLVPSPQEDFKGAEVKSGKADTPRAQGGNNPQSGTDGPRRGSGAAGRNDIKIGDILKARVTKTKDIGVEVMLISKSGEEVPAFISKSYLSKEKVEKSIEAVEKIVKERDVIKVKVLRFDEEKQKFYVSLKNALAEGES